MNTFHIVIRFIRTILKEDPEPERGDVPGWVLITLMTAGLVVAIWTVAQTQLVQVFQDAISRVTSI